MVLAIVDWSVWRRYRRAGPATIVIDNGTELTSLAQQETGVAWQYTPPGKPTQNAFIESFDGG